MRFTVDRGFSNSVGQFILSYTKYTNVSVQIYDDNIYPKFYIFKCL